MAYRMNSLGYWSSLVFFFFFLLVYIASTQSLVDRTKMEYISEFSLSISHDSLVDTRYFELCGNSSGEYTGKSEYRLGFLEAILGNGSMPPSPSIFHCLSILLKA